MYLYTLYFLIIHKTKELFNDRDPSESRHQVAISTFLESIRQQLIFVNLEV